MRIADENVALHAWLDASLPVTEERKLECAHCRHRFEFTDAEVRSGIVTYDDAADRWKVQRMDLPERRR